MTGLLVQVMADDNTGSTVSSEISTPSNEQVKDNEAPTTYREWSDLLPDDFEGAFEQEPNHEINKLKAEIENLKKVYSQCERWNEKLIKLQKDAFDEADKFKAKSKNWELLARDLELITQRWYELYGQLEEKTMELEEELAHLRGATCPSCFDTLKSHFDALKNQPVKIVLGCTAAVILLGCVAKKGINWYRQCCAKRKQTAQTAITTQEITVFEIR